jgi:hypothetical protein
MLEAKALTPKIVEQVWGTNPIIQKNLGGSRGDLALTQRCLISMAVVANNTFHLWLTTFFNKTTKIVPPESLHHVPPGVRDILKLVEDIPLPSTSTSLSQLDKTALTFFSSTYGQAPLTRLQLTLKTQLSPGIWIYY